MSALQLITKSIRLNHDEETMLAQISQSKGVSESALMKQLVLEGLARYRLEQAITAYRQSESDLSAAARFAGVSVYRLMKELEIRDVTPPATTKKFVQGLQTLFETFGGSEELRQTIAEFDPLTADQPLTPVNTAPSTK